MRTIWRMTRGRILILFQSSMTSWWKDFPCDLLHRTGSFTSIAMVKCPTSINSEAVTDKTWSWVLPKNGRIRGRSMLPLFITDQTWTRWMTGGTNMKKPTTLPTPNMVAAQAFPDAWREGGNVSTISARSIACTVWYIQPLISNDLKKLSLTCVDRKVQ